MVGSIARTDFSQKFLKQLRKAPLEVKQSFRQRYALFVGDPFDPLLNNHQLIGSLKNFRSINVTGDWRALYMELTENGRRVLIFVALGTHSQLYK